MKLREFLQTEQAAALGKLAGALLPSIAPVEKKVAQNAAKNIKTAVKAQALDSKKDDEESKENAAIIFGRFNPPHKGHKEAWQKASEFSYWYVGTNKSTQGPKDPLPFDVKVQAMLTIWPGIKGHILAEQTWWSLATKVYELHGPVTLHVVTDENDAKIFVPGLQKQNGVQGPHGYYNFKEIKWEPAPRLSSATDLRDAVRKNDRVAFTKAAGVSANTPVNGQPFFDLVAHYLNQYPVKESTLDIKTVNQLVREMKGSMKTISDDQKAAMQNASTLPALNMSTGSAYMNYRMGIALAGAPDYPTKMEADNWIGGDPLLSTYTEEEFEMIKKAAQQVGAGTIQNWSGKRSEEVADVNKSSPVAKPKRNKYGV